MSPLMFWTKLKTVGSSVWGLTLGLCIGWVGLGSSGGLWGSAIAAPAAPLQRGIEALQQQHYAAATQYFGQSIQQGQALADAYSYRCLAFLMQQHLQSATEDCAAALAIAPHHERAAFYQGLARYRLGQFEAAIAAFAQHLQTHPEDPRAYYNNGLAKFAQGDVHGATGQYHQALAYAADLSAIEMSNLYNDLGVAYWSNERLDEAKFALDQAVAMDRDDTRAYFNRGCICHHLGEDAAALRDFEQVLALNPHHAETYLNRGLIRQKLGERQAARQDYQTAFEQFRRQGNRSGAQAAKLRLQRLSQPLSTVG